MQTLRYSALRLLPYHPKSLKYYLYYGEKLGSKVEKDGQAIRFGTAVDCLLTTNTFWEKYALTEFKEPPTMMYRFIRAYIETGDELVAYKNSGYKMSLNTVLKNFNTPEVQYYYNAIKEGKELISNKSFEDIQNCAEKIDKSEWRYLFTDRLTQVNLEFCWKGVLCSGTLDVLDIDHEKKTIRGWDLKTTSDINTFEDSYYKFDYYLQATWYNIAIRQYLKDNNLNYKILPFRFLTVDKQHDYCLVFEATKLYKGLSELKQKILLWNWHVTNDIWVNKEHYLNNFVIQI